MSEAQLKKWETDLVTRINPESLKKLGTGLNLDPSELVIETAPPRLLTDVQELVAANIEIATSATEFLYVTGSRSRDEAYLASIEAALKGNVNLAHYRILFGKPQTNQLRQHLRNLFAMRDPLVAFVDGVQTFGVAAHWDPLNFPTEAAVCMNEHSALIVIPSINAPWGYDTALIFKDRPVIDGWKRWISSMLRTGDRIETQQQLDEVCKGDDDD